jgi:murein DD-endopeptidase MepM/ murein hydrolase activator NlpD
MSFQLALRDRFRLDGLAIIDSTRLKFGAAGVALCAAAATVAAVPSASAGTSEQSSSVTVAIPRKASPPPDTVFAEPDRAALQLFARLQPSDSLKGLLVRSSVAKSDIAAASMLMARTLPAGISAGTEIEISLGKPSRKGERRLERLTLQPAPAFRVTIGRTLAGNLKLARDAVSVDATPQHFRGRAGRDLFWSLRGAGVPAAAAREYLDVLSTRMDMRSVGPKDEFDIVIDHLRDATGKAESGPLLYAGLRRENGRSLNLVRWTVGDRMGWFDPSTPEQRVEGFQQPVRGGRITSRFGYRMHPILGFGRFHDGLDIGAAWGSPVFAAADGVVAGSGWSGGYGQQVRLAHPDGMMTSYAHLSRILAAPGARVQRGQLIGLVGSSGFSTGAHLHFEVRRFGRPIDPATFRYAGVQVIDATDLAALRARLEQLRSI